jgi:hypothetical protein
VVGRLRTARVRVYDFQVEGNRNFFANGICVHNCLVIVMQRINDNDLSAHVLATAEENYLHLKIEAEAPERRVFTFPRSGKILVREPGNLLWEMGQRIRPIHSIPRLKSCRRPEPAP